MHHLILNVSTIFRSQDASRRSYGSGFPERYSPRETQEEEFFVGASNAFFSSYAKKKKKEHGMPREDHLIHNMYKSLKK